MSVYIYTHIHKARAQKTKHQRFCIYMHFPPTSSTCLQHPFFQPFIPFHVVLPLIINGPCIPSLILLVTFYPFSCHPLPHFLPVVRSIPFVHLFLPFFVSSFDALHSLHELSCPLFCSFVSVHLLLCNRTSKMCICFHWGRVALKLQSLHNMCVRMSLHVAIGSMLWCNDSMWSFKAEEPSATLKSISLHVQADARCLYSCLGRLRKEQLGRMVGDIFRPKI